MLFKIDPILRGDALAVLRDLGHGDSICIADCNFPSFELARRADVPCIALGCDTVQAGRAILELMPLDSFVESPVERMEITGQPQQLNEAHKEFGAMVKETAGERWTMGSIERFAFYERTLRCSAIFATLDRRGYACFILTKGVIGPDGNVV